jgi:hypothetical protein
MQAHANRTCRRLDFYFLHEETQNFVYQIYSRVKKTYNAVEFPIQWCNSHADLAGWYFLIFFYNIFQSNTNYLVKYRISYKSHLTLHINVQSSQIGMSVVPLDRKINCIIGFFSLLNIFGTQSVNSFMQKNKNPTSCCSPACSVCRCSILPFPSMPD